MFQSGYVPKEFKGADTDTTGDQYGVIFGNWNDYFIGFWGAMEITVDSYTKADEGMVRLILNVFAAMGSLQSESFTTASMK